MRFALSPLHLAAAGAQVPWQAKAVVKVVSACAVRPTDLVPSEVLIAGRLIPRKRGQRSGAEAGGRTRAPKMPVLLRRVQSLPQQTVTPVAPRRQAVT